ncbi:hypothetical protein [Gemmatimonas sp.]|uniref:hypothetical protein n=1 Tax=Gemmatimonas sp. TaxID=1962908 RepID=UPI0035630FA4
MARISEKVIARELKDILEIVQRGEDGASRDGIAGRFAAIHGTRLPTRTIQHRLERLVNTPAGTNARSLGTTKTLSSSGISCRTLCMMARVVPTTSAQVI